MFTEQEALDYHKFPVPGKIATKITKSCATQKELSMAYSPGVALPCQEIEKNKDEVFNYTGKGNLVAVISDGTAVLGLGDIGPEASKPVMEGKGVLFKSFADIDVFDIELATKDTEEIINIVKNLEPTFGGINLEDISAPGCFEIEQRLIELMDIPVFHDDQHGTAIISAAALLNAAEIVGKKLDEMKIVINGAGASAIASAGLYIDLGAKKENIIMCDSKGVIYKGRTKSMNKYKEHFAAETDARNLRDAINGADLFVGLSVGNVADEDMMKSMAEEPIVFALANPTPEISYERATAARPEIIMATGRSDYPNQVNNVLGFPFIFRGALDVSAKAINTEMKLAAVHALAELAKQDVPKAVCEAYGVDSLSFSKKYIIPKPFDTRAFYEVSSAVAEAAIKSGAARKSIDIKGYKQTLMERMKNKSII